MKWFRKNNIEKDWQLKEDLLSVISLEIKKECEELIDYQANYTVMIEVGSFLKELITKLPKLKESSRIKSIMTDLEALSKIYQGHLADVSVLIAEEEKLSREIMQYSEVVKEMQEKFKLSIDWGGKKPHMISLGKQLTKKRENCLMAEKLLREKLNPLNQAFVELYMRFQEQYMELSAEIEKAMK